jgi:hypothetical protein
MRAVFLVEKETTMTHRFPLLASFCAVLGLTAGAGPVHAAGPIARTTYLTFSSPVALPGVTLAAGTYVFELAEPFGASTVVAVRDKTRTKHYFMGFTQRIERPGGLSREASVSFGEAPRGMAKPIVAWYPLDSTSGMKFIYPR